RGGGERRGVRVAATKRPRHARDPASAPLTPARASLKDARLTCAAQRRRQREDSVLVDHRYYHIKPGMTGAHLDLYEKHGFAAQTRHLGQPLAYMYTESGEVNT